MAKLQDKVTINGMQLCNRIALPPLTTNCGMPQGLVTDEIIQFYTVGKILAGKSSEIITCEECMTCVLPPSGVGHPWLVRSTTTSQEPLVLLDFRCWLLAKKQMMSENWAQSD